MACCSVLTHSWNLCVSHSCWYILLQLCPHSRGDAVNVVQGICNGQQKISLQLHSSSEESRYFASKLSTWLCILAKVMVSWLVWSLVVEAKLFVATSLWSKCRIAAAAAAENCCDNLNDVKDEWHFFCFWGFFLESNGVFIFGGWGVVNDDFYAVVSTFDKPFFPSHEHYYIRTKSRNWTNCAADIFSFQHFNCFLIWREKMFKVFKWRTDSWTIATFTTLENN